jgi:hypothetical protein
MPQLRRRDETQGWYVSTDEDMPAGYTGEDQTSEVITEAPTECPTPTTCQELPLTNFGSVGYYNTLYNASAADWYTSANTIKIDLYENGTTETDSVGALGTDGAFTVIYGTPPPPPPVDKVGHRHQSRQPVSNGRHRCGLADPRCVEHWRCDLFLRSIRPAAGPVD